MKLRRLKKGFTLVELVVVIAIIAVLAGVSVAVYSSVTNNAKKSADSQVVAQLNTKLRADGLLEGKNKTAMEAFEDADEIGFNLSRMTPQYGDHYVWDEKNDLFAVMKGNEVVFEDTTTKLVGEDEIWKRWIFTSKPEESEKRSQFFIGESWDELTVHSGFDAGLGKVEQLNYINKAGDPDETVTPKDVVIRTNSASTELVVDAPADTIKHHGSVGMTHIIAVDSMNCFEENGKAAFTQVDSGKYKTTASADVELLFVSNVENVSVSVVPGTVDHAHAISDTDADAINQTNPGVIFDYDNNEDQEELDVYHHIGDENNIGLTEDYGDNKNNGTVVSIVTEAKIEEEANVPAFTVGGIHYDSLAEAFEKFADDETAEIVLNKDITIKFDTAAYITIKEEQNINIDLNGYKIDIIATRDSSSAFIKNEGTLTLQDSKAKVRGIGDGSMKFLSTDPDDKEIPGYAGNLISNYGTLTINGGCYDNTTTGGAATYVLDNYGGSTTVINGGKFYKYSTNAIRLFCSTDPIVFTINDGEFAGYGGSIWAQGPNKNENIFYLTINGGVFNTTANAVVNGTSDLCSASGAGLSFLTYHASYGDSNYSAQSIVKITGGTFNENIYMWLYDGDFELSGGKLPKLEITNGKFNGYVLTNGGNANITGGSFIFYDYGNGTTTLSDMNDANMINENCHTSDIKDGYFTVVAN